jgi:modulator of FtsH protease HflC
MNATILRNPIYMGLAALGALILLSMSVNVVPETQQAIISSYGKVDRVVNPYRQGEQFGKTRAGLTFRIPFVEQIQMIDKRVLSVEMEQQEVLSTDQLRLQVDAFARFRITKPWLIPAQRTGQAHFCDVAERRARRSDGEYPDRLEPRSRKIWR